MLTHKRKGMRNSDCHVSKVLLYKMLYVVTLPLMFNIITHLIQFIHTFSLSGLPDSEILFL